MKITNKQSIQGIEKSSIWAKLRTIALKTDPAQFYVLSEQRTSNKSGKHSFKVSKNRSARTQQVSVALAPEKGVLLPDTLVSHEGKHLIFIFNMDILDFWSMCPFP